MGPPGLVANVHLTTADPQCGGMTATCMCRERRPKKEAADVRRHTLTDASVRVLDTVQSIRILYTRRLGDFASVRDSRKRSTNGQFERANLDPPSVSMFVPCEGVLE